MRKYLKKLKWLIRTPFEMREEEDKQLLTKFIQKQNFFRKRDIQDVKKEEFMELQKCFKILNVRENQVVMRDQED